LRARRKRPSGSSSTEKCDELASPHLPLDCETS